MTHPSNASYNPYPLSQLRTERMWEGKEDESGVGVALSVQHHPAVSIAGRAIPMPQIYQRLNTTPEAIAAFCEKWQIAELAVFGSVLRDDFRPNGTHPSDVDLLFSYLPGANMSLLRRAKMKIELEHLFGRSVDLLMAIEVIDSHNLIRRKHILDSTQIVYVKR